MNTHLQDVEIAELWECPTCLQPFDPHHDYECGTCEAKASEHLRVTTMCKLLRETQRRENALIIERDKLQRQLAVERSKNSKNQDVTSCPECDALASHGSNEGPCDVHKGFTSYLEACASKPTFMDKLAEQQAELKSVRDRLLNPHAVYINMLHGTIAKLDWPKLEHVNGPHPLREQLANERALADRLAGIVEEVIEDLDEAGGDWPQAFAVLAAWKEARSE